MQTIARGRFWIVDLIAIAFCACLLARASAHAVELRLLRSSPPVPSPAPPAHRTPPPDPSRARDAIVDRNVFCSTCPPPLRASIPPADDRLAAESQRSSLPLELLAVNQLLSRSRPRQFTAVLRDRESKAVGAFASGDRVMGALITGIDETRLHLLHGGREEFLDLLDTETIRAAAPAESSTRGPAPSAEPGHGLSRELDRGIRKVGERAFEIQRSTLEALLGNVGLLATSARITPEIRDGRTAGLRLVSVQPQGPFAKIGLQSGDVILSINGLELTSPERGFEVFGKLRSASHLSLELERARKRAVIDYSVR
jgi:general secretion pathway protein C